MLVRLVACLCWLAGLSSAGLAQTYPSKSVKLVVPLTPGSPIDASGRVIAHYLQTQLGQSFVIENRPGAGTTIGTRAVATAEPDGYTLLVAGATIASIPFFYPGLDFDPSKAFTPVATVASWSHVIGIGPEVPARSVAELVTYAKANPGKLVFGYGLGTAPHILGATLREATGMDITFLPYRGGEQARTDLLGGRVHINIAPGTSLIPLVLDGKVRGIAVTGRKREPDLPDVPTMTESGFPQVGYHPDAWTGLLVPSGTPAVVVETLSRTVARGLETPEVRAALTRLGMEPMALSPQQYAAFLAAELKEWPPRFRAAGLKPQQ